MMKRKLVFTIAVLTIILACALVGCNSTKKYKVTVDAEHASDCEVGHSYSAGEEVSVKLPTITEHYYSLYVNEELQQMDRERSDMGYTYFTFTMPDCDVEIRIEDHSVEIPEAPEQ